MKKIIVLFVSILCLCSCTMEKTVYEYTISYTIEGTSFTETHTIDMPAVYVPSYRLGNGALQIIGSCGMSSMTHTTIYKGSLNVKVTNFDYKVIRTYKASKWDGHELKSKK